MATTIMTCDAIELDRVDPPTRPAPATRDDREIKRVSRSRPEASSGSASLLGELGGFEPGPTPAMPAAEKWNQSRSHIYRVAATFFCFMVMGANDAAYGVCVPSTDVDAPY